MHQKTAPLKKRFVFKSQKAELALFDFIGVDTAVIIAAQQFVAGGFAERFHILHGARVRGQNLEGFTSGEVFHRLFGLQDRERAIHAFGVKSFGSHIISLLSWGWWLNEKSSVDLGNGIDKTILQFNIDKLETHDPQARSQIFLVGELAVIIDFSHNANDAHVLR